MLSKARLAAPLVLIAVLIASASLTGGCGRRAAIMNGQVKAQPASEGDEPWKPFVLHPGDYFKYTMIDHVQGGKQGWITVQVKEKGEGELEARWDGELDGKKFSVTTTAPSDRLIELSRPQLITSPPAVPFLATILSAWWDHIFGFKWQVGVSRSVLLTEMVPAAFTLTVVGHCNAAGVNGFRGWLTTGAVHFSEICVSPSVPFLLSVLTRSAQGDLRYEARLIELRTKRK